MTASILLKPRDIHEISMYHRDNYSSLSDAMASNAVYTVNIEELTGNLHNSGSLYTAMQLVNTVLDCIGYKGKDIAFVVTDAQGGIVDCT